MDQFNTNPNIIMPESNMGGNKSIVSTLTIIVIVLALALGGYYVWKNYLGATKNTPAQTGSDAGVSISDLESNLAAVDVSTSSELGNLEKQF